MSTLAPFFDAWDEAHNEFAIALERLPDAELWKRADPRLLSVGELAGHIVYWQIVWTMGGGDHRPELASLQVQSPLLQDGFRYYADTADRPYALTMTTSEVANEVRRVHLAVKAALSDQGSDDPYPSQWETWGNLIRYQVFHVAYHTGQAYSVRHLLGHETEDN